MMDSAIRAELLSRVHKSRATTQSDSLTVILNLADMTPAVLAALKHVLLLPDHLDGSDIPEQAPADFARRNLDALSELTVADGIEFATAISAFIHECRHVHDLRSTRMGAELLLHDLRVYSGIGALLDRLSDWQSVHPDLGIPLPLSGELELFTGEFEDIANKVRASLVIRERVSTWWNTRSNTPMIPGYSIRDLFEFVAFSTQIGWLQTIFPDWIARSVFALSLDDESTANKYWRPFSVMTALASRFEPPYQIAPVDASRLFWSALNANGIEVTVENGDATAQHPGTWFVLFGNRLVDPTDRPSYATGRESAWACEFVLAQHDVPGPKERFEAASAALDALQPKTFRDMLGPKPNRFSPYEAVLVASEVAIDYRDMNRLICRDPSSHAPKRYVDLLVSGQLTTVHVRVFDASGPLGDFRTASHIPSNGVGAARIASQASQQMRLLLEGTGAVVSPYAAEVLATMRGPGPGGHGLRFRLGKPAPTPCPEPPPPQ